MESTSNTTTRTNLAQLVRHLAVPFALFAGVLLTLLLLSWLLLLPRFTSVSVNGTQRSAVELLRYHSTLQADILVLEEERAHILQPSRGELYDALHEEKLSHPSYQTVRDAIESVAALLVTDTPDAVHIDAFWYQPLEGVVVIKGDIRNVGPRSMTVLAQFGEALQQLPFVSAVSSSKYQRLEDKTRGPYSPFDIRLSVTK